MATPVQQEPAYVLHRRPYRETSLLVDLFTLNHGRMGLIVRGAHTPKSPLKAQLQPFQPLLVDWQGRGELKTLTQVEVRPGVRLGQGRALYSGFYINELLLKLLPAADASPELFAAYLESLASLAALLPPADVEPVLRSFEMSLADAMGYGFSWSWASDTGRAVASGNRYCYDPQLGLLETPTANARLQALRGDLLLNIGEGNLTGQGERRLAKQVMRSLVDFLLQGRPLNSRALFTRTRAAE